LASPCSSHSTAQAAGDTICEDDAPFKGEKLKAKALDHKAPEPLRRLQHDHDGDCAQHDEVDGTQIGQELAQQARNTSVPTIGPSMRPMPPITVMKITKAVQSLTAEGGVGRDSELLQEDERAHHGGAERGDDVDDELDARDIDAVALGGELVVADCPQRQAVA
jgi:hypothetical protein